MAIEPSNVGVGVHFCGSGILSATNGDITKPKLNTIFLSRNNGNFSGDMADMGFTTGVFPMIFGQEHP